MKTANWVTDAPTNQELDTGAHTYTDKHAVVKHVKEAEKPACIPPLGLLPCAVARAYPPPVQRHAMLGVN